MTCGNEKGCIYCNIKILICSVVDMFCHICVLQDQYVFCYTACVEALLETPMEMLWPWDGPSDPVNSPWPTVPHGLVLWPLETLWPCCDPNDIIWSQPDPKRFTVRDPVTPCWPSQDLQRICDTALTPRDAVTPTSDPYMMSGTGPTWETIAIL